jgi:type II secretory pathway component PulJ
MTQGLRNDRTQRRRRTWVSAWKWLGAIAILAIVGVYAFKSGARFTETELAGQLAELDGLRQETARLTEENEQLRATVAARQQQASAEAQQRIRQLEETLAAQTSRLQELEQRFGEAQGPDSDGGLLALVQEKLDAGVEPSRILAAVEGIREPPKPPERVCDQEPETRRFQVQVPGNIGEGQNRITFENGRLRVTATAPAAVNENGRVESWFDPTKPVTVFFNHRNGFNDEVTGVLPMAHELTIGGVDERFLIEPNVRGFIQVTGGRCRFR